MAVAAGAALLRASHLDPYPTIADDAISSQTTSADSHTATDSFEKYVFVSGLIVLVESVLGCMGTFANVTQVNW